MPKLAAKVRKKVEKAKAVSSDFEPLSPGKYVGTLSAVEAKDSSAGNAMWAIEFEDIHDLDGERQPGRQWMNLMLPQDVMPEDYKPKSGKKSPKDAWEAYQAMTEGRIKQFFEAFGFTVDSDTDEMIGEKCVLQIGIRTIQNGPKAGQKSNQVNGVAPLDSIDFEAGEGEGEDGDNF